MVDLGCNAGITFDTTGQFVSEIAVMAPKRVEYQIDWGVCGGIEACVGWLPNTSSLGEGR